MPSLQLVSGQGVAAPSIFGPRKIIKKQEIVTVSESDAATLLEMHWTDAAGTKQPYFVPVTSAEPAKAEPVQEELAEEPTTTPATSRRRTAKSSTAE